MDCVISVILPVYNVQPHLEKAMVSLKSQTIGLEKLDVIFCDDCSTDGSWEKIQEFAREYPNVKAIRRQTNSGGCGAPRNDAMKRATGEYVAFFDPDDELEPDAYETLLCEAQRTKAEIVTGYFSEADENGRITVKKNGAVSHLAGDRIFQLPDQLREAFCLFPMVTCKLYQRRFLQENNIQFPHQVCEDQPFVIHCALCARKIAYVDRAVYRYIQRGGSLSKHLDARYFSEVSEMVHACAELFQAFGHERVGREYVSALLEDQLQKLAVNTTSSQQALELLKSFEVFFAHPQYCMGGVASAVAASWKTCPEQAGKVLFGCGKLVQAFDNARRDANIWRHSCESAQGALEDAKKYISDLERRGTQLEKALADERRMRGESDERLKQMQTENDHLQSELRKTREELEAMRRRRAVRAADKIGRFINRSKSFFER